MTNRFFGNVTGLTQSPVGLDTGLGSGLGTFYGDGSDGDFNPETALTGAATAPNGGTLASLFDRNAGTTFLTGTIGAASDNVVFSIDFGVPQIVQNIRIYGAQVSTNRTYLVQSSTNGVGWTNRGSANITTSATDFTLTGVTSGTTYNPIRFWRLASTAGTAGTISLQGITVNFVTGDLQTDVVWRVLYPTFANYGLVTKQFASLTVPAGYHITTDNPCRGLVLYSQGAVTIGGSLDMSQKAGLAPSGEIIPMVISRNNAITSITSSLMHFDGTNGSTTMTDATGKAWTAVGNAQLSTAQAKFGASSLFLDGAGDFIRLNTPSDDFSFMNDNFTIDFWFQPNVTSTLMQLVGTDQSIGAGGLTGTTPLPTFVFEITATNRPQLTIGTSGTTTTVTRIGVTPITTGAWFHAALVRDGETVRLYMNGVQDISIPYSGAFSRAISQFILGAQNGTANFFNGWIDEFRVVKGKAMFTAAFTPAAVAYTYTPTFLDTPAAVEQYNVLTTSLQGLRGGYGGHGGYGGGHTGSTGRVTTIGYGGSGRQNQGGYGGGGSGGSANVSGAGLGGTGGSITAAELGGGRIAARAFGAGGGNTQQNGTDGANGAGGVGGYATSSSGSGTINATGQANGGGGGGTGGSATSTFSTAGNNGQFAGGFLGVVTGGSFANTGTVRSNGGNGGDGTAGAAANCGGGGGGGGAGGGVVAIYYAGSFSNSGTLQVNGGSGGAGGAAGASAEAGGAGTSGGDGMVLTQRI